MPKVTASLSFLLLALMLAPPRTQAQDQAVYQIQPDSSKLWVEGTSNKSDWTVYAADVQGQVTMNEAAASEDPGVQSVVQSVQVTVPSEKIASNKSTIMDRLMRQTLKVEEHPEITYTLTSATPTDGAEVGGFALQTNGELTLAGVTKPVEMTVQGQRLDNGHMRFTGQHTLLMTEYEMQPPSAMFGALRTGDEVTVHFDLDVAPETSQ